METQQRTIEVWKGNQLLTVVPAVAESTIREIYSGSEDEKLIRIIDPTKRAAIAVEQKAAVEKIAAMRTKVENEKITALEAQVNELKELLLAQTKQVQTGVKPQQKNK